jgi:hypothetical protein
VENETIAPHQVFFDYFHHCKFSVKIVLWIHAINTQIF